MRIKMIKMYQVSTLQALAMGYTRGVITVQELLKHGSIGLGTFEDVNGEVGHDKVLLFQKRNEQNRIR